MAVISVRNMAAAVVFAKAAAYSCDRASRPRTTAAVPATAIIVRSAAPPSVPASFIVDRLTEMPACAVPGMVQRNIAPMAAESEAASQAKAVRVPVHAEPAVRDLRCANFDLMSHTRQPDASSMQNQGGGVIADLRQKQDDPLTED